MELKNIFKMTKTDRYTQDGRDELAKLQETEDVKYKTGDISQKTGLQKQPDGSWAPPKKGGKPTGKNGPSRMEKEEAIRKDLGLRGENDLERFSDEQIEMMYQKSQRTPEQQKADFDNSKIGQAVNKGRQEFAAEKARQKELASKTNAIGLPKKPAAESNLGNYPGWKPNKVESMGNGKYRIEGTQFYFETPEEAQTAIVAGRRGEGKTWARPSKDKTINEIENALGFKLDTEYGGKHSMDDFMKKTGENEYAVKVWSFGTDSKGTLIDTIVEGYNKPDATIKKENGEWRLHYTDRDGKKMIVTPKGREWPTSDSAPRDAAPRQLTGDTRIRIRK